ncbi:YkyA family protein [Bacillus sp. 31A1R]|uniref:YkyA family protein n=1 Tax=Robertmurraya mangrovi TaxID=3098077 RepID=A0ABU5IU08_9BACI|nr:YkyA family protein [Bacillus sp. 31A1R]MDZ5470622.1 YkyA family protein [Bacillus sp. 31A1R]
MSIFRNARLFLIVIAGSIFLTGCLNTKSPTEKIYEVLESVVQTEQGFEDQQDPLVNLEQQEKKLYDKIIALGMKEFDQIIKLSDEALTMVDQRKEHMEKEKESINKSSEEFKKIVTTIEDIEDPKVKEKARNMYATMMERYDIHNELYSNYMQGLEYDKELYELFKNKEVSLEQLEEQIKKINESYENVLNANERFNEQTQKYNELKLEFYKQAGLEVKSK